MNPLFQELNGPNSMMGAFSQFIQNPLAFVMQRRNIEIPSQFGSNPQEAVNYLVSSGKMDQVTYNNLRAQAMSMGCKF